MPKKKKRDAARRLSAKSRRIRRRIRWIAILVLIGGAIGLYVYDYRVPLETIPGTVASTRTYPHKPRGGNQHTHTEAVLDYEGSRHTVARADGVEEGQSVEVDVRRGRLSGRLRFVAFRQIASDGPAGLFGLFQPVAWAYDIIEDRYWHPIHGHWHDGRPPPPGQR